MVIGHEYVGEVAGLGAGVTGLHIGQRVSGEGHADARRDDADGSRAGDQHVLAHHVPHQRRMGRVAEGVKKGDDVLRQALVDAQWT